MMQSESSGITLSAVTGADRASEASTESDNDERKATYVRAIRMLAGREHSAHELSRKLIAKGHSQQSVEAALTKLQELDLQSDQRFAEMYVRSRVNKGYGPIKIRQDLYQRGLDDELIDAELTFPAERWVDLARSIRGKRFPDAQPDGRDAWNTQARFLARRGFPADLIYRVLGQL